MWYTSTGRLPQLPTCPLCVAGANVYPVSVVRDLEVYIDNDLGATTHVRRTVSRYFAALRCYAIFVGTRYVTDECFRSLVVSLIHSRLDYGNFVMVELICNDIYNLCSTQRLVWFFDFVATTASQRLSLLFTGCVYQSGSTSKLQL